MPEAATRSFKKVGSMILASPFRPVGSEGPLAEGGSAVGFADHLRLAVEVKGGAGPSLHPERSSSGATGRSKSTSPSSPPPGRRTGAA